jgi:CRP-like cAMP-binding protein
VSVTIDGVTKPDPLEPGSYFGEIALLRSIPRTATVTAIEPTRMFVLRAADFLAAVTGGADGAAVAYEVSQRYDDLSKP